MESRFGFLASALVLAAGLHCGGDFGGNQVLPLCEVGAKCSDGLGCEGGACQAAPAASANAADADGGAPSNDGAMSEAAEGGTGTANCAPASIATTRPPVALEIVLDGSVSMSDGTWAAAQTALNAFLDSAAAKASDDLAVGLLVFEDQKDSTFGLGPYPSAADVAPAVVDASQRAALGARLATSPRGGSPIYLALSGAYRALGAFSFPVSPAFAGAQKAAVLITDGVPNGGATEEGLVVSGASQAWTAAMSLSTSNAPIRSVAIGVGAFPNFSLGYDPRFLSQLALAGGSQATSTCSPDATAENQLCHIQVTPTSLSAAQLQARLLNALLRARAAAGGCDLAFAAREAFDTRAMNVAFFDEAGQSTAVAMGGPDGWSLEDATPAAKIHFAGQSCTALGAAASVQIEACRR